MGKSVYIVFLLAAVLGMSSCHKGKDVEIATKPEPVVLKVKVSLSDLLPKTRAEGDNSPYAVAANDNEKVQTLRVIVVNSRNEVEGNVHINLMKDGGTPVEEQTVMMRNIASNDTKMIYLIANEEATRKSPVSVGDVPLVDYDFNKIKAGGKFPIDELFELKMQLNENSDHLSNGLKGGCR